MVCNKVCFYFPFKSFASLSGSCTVGMVSPSASKEKVVVIKEGDAIPVPMGLVSWWFNAGDSDTVIVFIGETSISQISGEMTYFFLTGTVGVLRGFSTEFISKAYNLNQNEANTLVTNQTGEETNYPKLSHLVDG